jgi:hypothetical protein
LLGDLESAAYLASDHDPFFLLNTNPLIFAQRYFDEVDEEAMATSVTVVASNIRANVNFLNVPSSSEGIPSGGGGGTSIPTVLLSEDAAAGCQVRSIPFSPNALVEMMLFFTPLLLPLWKKRTLP